ncbi:MAG TPA: hypothetical protein VL633_00825 [Bacteroidota bacterium]|nr:hypothetical protein [Bacteroidota bacterium]
MLCILVFVGMSEVFVGCAPNLTLSDSISYADAASEDLKGLHIIEGGTLSANVVPQATSYGATVHAADSISGLTYPNFNPCIGYSYGIASRSFAAALSVQMFMLGADLTIRPGNNLFVTGNITTNSSFGLACTSRLNRSITLGPFYRRDRFEGFILGDGAKWLRDSRYFADTYGLKGSFMYSAGSGYARIIFLAAGYNPEVESIFISVGMNGFKIH